MSASRPGRRRCRSWWPRTTGRCASTQLLAAPARPDAAARALRGDRRGRRLVRRHAGRSSPREARRGALRLCIPPPVRAPGPAVARNRGWRLARAPVVAFTDDDCVPTPGLARDAPSRGALADPTRSSAAERCPNPAEAHSLGSFCEDRAHRRAEPALRDLQRRLPARRCSSGSAASTSRSRHRLRRGLRPRLPRASRPAGPRRSSRTRWCTTPCWRASPRRRSATRSSRPMRVRAYKRPPAAAAGTSPLGVFYDRSHPLLLIAAGALLARRKPAAAALAVPVRPAPAEAACAARGARPRHAAFFALFDVVQLGATVRGAAAAPHVRRLTPPGAALPFRRGASAEWPSMETRSSRWICSPYEVSRRPAPGALARRLAHAGGRAGPPRPRPIPDEATRFLNAAERHDPLRACPGSATACELILGHVERGVAHRGARRLRRGRRLLHRHPRAGAARARGRSHLGDPQPLRRRVRPLGRPRSSGWRRRAWTCSSPWTAGSPRSPRWPPRAPPGWTWW